MSTVMLSRKNRLKPAWSAVSEYTPGGRKAKEYAPAVVVIAGVFWLVALVVKITTAPGTHSAREILYDSLYRSGRLRERKAH